MWVKKLALFMSSLIFCALMLVLAEAVTRFLRPDINFQDTERSLLRDNAFGNSYGWRPNARGVCFGRPVEIDEFGCRKLESPESPEASWLILGDSVTFGVGVDAKDTYVQLLQNDLPSVKLWNTAVIGYNVNDYRNVLQHYTAEGRGVPDIRRVVLFFCLNDIDLGHRLENDPNLPYRPPAYAESLFSYLRRHSKLYMLAKNAVSDRSEVYFLHDSQLYKEAGEDFRGATAMLGEMNAFLKGRGVDFTVVVLPYEYQLRADAEERRVPQKLLAAYFEEAGIAYVDAFEHFARSRDKGENFLYADFGHLSKRGHRLVYDLLKESFRARGPVGFETALHNQE